MKDIHIKGGGNVITLCGNLSNKEKKIQIQSFQAVGQTTTDDQRQQFVLNVESQIEKLNNSSKSLRNQNSKMIFSQTLNWLQANQIVIFDLMLGFSVSDSDQIELFEHVLIKLLEAILHILKRELNVYLGFIIAKQASIIATAIHKYYLAVGLAHDQQQKIIIFKNDLNQNLEKIFYTIDKFKEKNISTNYLEQSLRLIESFTFALPQESTFKPFLNFATGFGQMIAFGGTRGWDQMFNGIKEGVSQVINKKIHQEQVDNFIMYGTLDTVKFSIIKILQQLNNPIKNQEQQIQKDDNPNQSLDDVVKTLQLIGKNIENGNNWLYKYYFVQILGELILFQGTIDQDQLNIKLNEKDFPYDEEMVWQVLLQNNWVVQFKQDENIQEKCGFLSLKRTSLENFSLKKNKKHKKKKNIQVLDSGMDESIQEDKEEFISELNKILIEFETIKPNIREFILKGNKLAFKGLLGYCFEGLDSSDNIVKDAIMDLYQGRSPLEVLEISFKRIITFALDFFAQQFTSIILNTENQLRNIFINLLADHKEEIAINIKKNQFNTIINTSPQLKSFPTLISNYLEQITGFINKILTYLDNVFNPLQRMQQVVEKIQDPGQSFKGYLVNQSSTIFNTLVDEQNQIFLKIKNHLEQYTHLIQGCGQFIELIDSLVINYQNIRLFTQILIKDGIDQISEPCLFVRLRQLYKQISSIDEKDQNYSQIKLLLKKCFQDIVANGIQMDFFQDIQNNISNFDLNSILEPHIEEFQSQDNQIYSIQDGKLFYHLKLINELFKNTFLEHKQIVKDLETMKKEAFQNDSNTYALQWIQTVNLNISSYIQENPQFSIQELQSIIQQQSELIQQQGLEQELKNDFVLQCNNIWNIFNNLMKKTTDIFNDINKIIKDTDPIVFQSITTSLDDLKTFVSSELEQIKETLLDDIKNVYKEFEKSEFAQEVNKAVSQLRSLTDFLDVGGLVSILEDKYSDQTWRIRDLTVLILFDLNSIFGGQDGDQIYANTLIHIKAKETNQKVQQTLKNEELLLQMKQILQSNWKSQESMIKNYVKDHFKALDEYVKKMKEEKNQDKKKILKNYEKKENQLNQQLENIQDIGSLAGIQLEFLKDIKKQIFKLQQDVEEIKESMKKVEENMLLLKGKSVYQLFEERRQQKKAEMYVDEQTQVYIPIKGSKIVKRKKIGKKQFQFIRYNPEQDVNPDYSKKIGTLPPLSYKEEDEESLQSEEDRKSVQLENEEINSKLLNQKKKLLRSGLKNIINYNLLTGMDRKYILENFMNDQYNSLLIHGNPGSGKSRLCNELEQQVWLQRRVTKQQVFVSILSDRDAQELLKNYSVDEIYEMFIKYQFIDKQGYFTDNFIQIESEFDDIKFANRIRKEQENKDVQTDDDFALDDIQTEGGQIFFQKKFSDLLMEMDKKVVSMIYQILDRSFQSKPYPIYAELSKIVHPQGELLKEALQQSFYNFDDLQIRKVRELAQQGDINLIFILDGYFQMKQEFIGLNLFTNNNFEVLRKQDDMLYTYPKVIITSRTNYLPQNDYSPLFQNIFQKSQKFDYQPQLYHLEYCIDDLTDIQIKKYFYEKFIKTLRKICYNKFSKQFIVKSSQKNKNEDVDKEFTLLWSKILETVEINSEQKQLWLSKQFKNYLISTYRSKGLLPLEDENKFLNQLNKINTQHMYEKIVLELNIQHLLNSVLMIHIFINAIEKLIEKLCSKSYLKDRISSALIQNQILQNYDTINVDSIINLLCKGNYDLLENFSYCWEQEDTIRNIRIYLQNNYIIKENEELLEKLTQIICYAMYFKHITRYQLYDIFYNNYITNQIENLRIQRRLSVAQDVMYKDCKIFAYRLAEAFHAHNKIYFKRLELSQLYWKKNIWDEFFNDTEQPLRELVRQCLPFISNGDVLHFMHESIKDFILAHAYFDMVNKMKLNENFINIMNQFKKQINKFQNVFIAKTTIDQQSFDITDITQHGGMEQFLKQTREMIRQEIQETMKNEVMSLKKEIQDIKKSLNQQESESENVTYLDNFMNNVSEQQQFIIFYQKITQIKLTQKQIVDEINLLFDLTSKIIQQQLNKSALFYNYKNIGICDLLIDKMRILDIPDFKNHFIHSLHILIHLGRLDERFSNTAANAIGLLILRNYSFNNVDFSGLNFSACNLYGGQFFNCIFENCNLERTNLQQSILYKCKFSNSQLNFVNLQNCLLSKSKFTKNCQLNNINLGRELDIFYDDQIQKQNHPDQFVHVIIDPINPNCLIVFHTWFVLRINIQSENRSELIKSFDQQIDKCPLIKFNQYNYIIGVNQKIGMFNLENLEFIDWIQLKNINSIYSIQYNQENQHLLIGGISISGEKYIEIGQFMGDQQGISKILTDQCDYSFLITSKKQLICYSDLDTPQIIVKIYNYLDYSQQIGSNQQITIQSLYKQFGQFKNLIYQQHNILIKHPKEQLINIKLQKLLKNIYEIIVTRDELIEIQQYDKEGAFTSKIKKKTHTINQIRIFDDKKYGNAQQIIVNPQFPDFIFCVYSYGLIQIFQFQSEIDKNYEICKDNLQVSHMQYLIKVPNKERQFLTCYMHDQYSGIICLAFFKYYIIREVCVRQFSVHKKLELKTRKKPSQEVVKNKVLSMMNHKKLIDQFLLVVLQNKEQVLKFTIDSDLHQLSKQVKKDVVQVKDLSEKGDLFEGFTVHPENHEIFCFSFNQAEIPFVVLYDVTGKEKTHIVQFQEISLSWKFFYDQKWIISFDRQGSVKLFDYYGKNQFKLNPEQKNLMQLNTVIGVQPNNTDALIIVSYDYLNQTITKYFPESQTVKSTNLNGQFEYFHKGNKVVKNCSYLFETVKNDLEESNQSPYKSLAQQIDQYGWEKVQKIFQARIQLIFHPFLAFIFIVFKEEQSILIYSLDRDKIIQLIELPFYFDPSVQLSIVTHSKNQYITILSYASHIQFMVYSLTEDGEKFKTIYQKSLSKTFSIYNETQFDNCIINQDNYTILKQHGVKLTNCQLVKNNELEFKI